MEFASCLPDKCFCEAIRRGTVLQPVNTYSSLSIAVVGLGIIFFSLLKNYRKKNLLIPRILLGIILLFLGISTSLFHARFTYLDQILDNLGMYLYVSYLIFFSIYRRYKFKVSLLIAFFVLVNIFSLIINIWLHNLSRIFFAILAITLPLVEILPGKKVVLSNKLFLFASGMFILGFFFWILDITKILCNPTSIIQGHAIWHILTAVSAVFIFLYIIQTDR